MFEQTSLVKQSVPRSDAASAAASDQGPLCLPVIKQCWDASQGSNLDMFKFDMNWIKEYIWKKIKVDRIFRVNTISAGKQKRTEQNRKKCATFQFLPETSCFCIWYNVALYYIYKLLPSKHTTSQQRRYNVAATSWHCSDVVTAFLRRCVFAGKINKVWETIFYDYTHTHVKVLIFFFFFCLFVLFCFFYISIDSYK